MIDHLTEQSKEELIKEILELREKLRKLEEELKKAKEQGEKKAVWVREHKPRRRWKPLGRPVGHVGCTRRKPSRIEHEVRQELDRCPDCGGQHLTELASQAQEHVQEDVVPARVEATRFIRQAYWCADCRQKKTAPYASEEVPYGYVGPNVLIWTILMKYQYGLPYSKIQLLLRQLCGLTISQGALAQALQRLTRWLEVEEGVILEAIRASPHLHMDETGWKIAGGSHWLWAAVNEKLALYRIAKSRGQKVPEEILTKEYGGVVVSDFLSAYNRIGRRRQRCLVHLLREMKDRRETDGSAEYMGVHRKLSRILADARRLKARQGKLAIWVFFRRLRLLKERLFDFVARSYANANCRRLVKRLRRCHEELLTFLEVPGLPWENNLAERMIRPNVLLRKVSFQNMSRKGADAHQTLMSLVQTLRLQDRDPVSFLKAAFLRHRQGNPAPLLHLATAR